MITVPGKPWSNRSAAKWESDSTYFSHNVSGLSGTLLGRTNSRLSVAEIAIAYAFDGGKYSDDLRRHGVAVPRT